MGGRAGEGADPLALQVVEDLDAAVVLAHHDLLLEDVVGPAEEGAALVLVGQLDPVDDHVEGAAVEGRDEAVPVGLDGLHGPAETLAERIGQLLLVADDPVGVLRVGEGVGGSPFQVHPPPQGRRLRRAG
ncbi:hypothetical protein D3C87_1588360 [compost metagenome]